MNYRGVARNRRAVRDGRSNIRPTYVYARQRAYIHKLSHKAAALAAGQLRHTDPLASAALGISQRQRRAGYAITLMIAGLTMIAPRGTALTLHHSLWVFFACAIAFRVLLLVLSFKNPPGQARLSDDEDLPVYTLLIPLYREANVLPGLCAAIGALNYPKDRLDIKLLLEAEDATTIQAVMAYPLGPHWEVIITPNIGPQTKPKALNAGLERARGTLVSIYDAEDHPHPDQLRHAVAAFANDKKGNLGCVQAPLGYYNADQNWLTKQFALEYAAQFQVLVPAMARLGLPFPLGGTSNHFRAEALHNVGAWDPYNVTEDADLSYRLHAKGWRLGTITPPTLEEATSHIGAWQRQRSRWLKGYVQTIGVHMRRPAPHRALAGAVSMIMTLGIAVLSAFGHASFTILMALALGLSPWLSFGLHGADYALALAGLLVGMGMLGRGAKRAGLSHSWWDIISAILYWPLQSWAMAKAVVDLIKRPFHWEKTTHGLCAPPVQVHKIEDQTHLDKSA
ncbi:MAG: glycosyltransferase [Robiginitomaculum sp.]|nr:MAG: glycosyltransferase [Robiginitomaculum sp.]